MSPFISPYLWEMFYVTQDTSFSLSLTVKLSKAADRRHCLTFLCSDILVTIPNIITLIVIKTVIAIMSCSRVYSRMSCSEIDVN